MLDDELSKDVELLVEVELLEDVDVQEVEELLVVLVLDE